MRVRLPSNVLIIDDSPTMRSIVRKTLAGRRFPLQISEAGEGFDALKQLREGDFHIVFLDHNMPGFSGLETLVEFKREKRRVAVVLMTSAQHDVVAACAVGRRRFPEEAVFPGRHRSRAVRLLRPARAQSETGVKIYWREI
jgi:DNA-binding NtrC family response regulator